MNHLQDKVILITGASSGIGHALATALDAFDVRLVLVARRSDRLDKLANTLISETLVIEQDLLNTDSLQGLVQNTVEHFGRLDILINNAGIGGTVGLITEMPDEQLTRMLDLNLKVPMLLSKHAIAQFTQQGEGGTILMMNSIAGKTAFPFWATYDATKAGLKAFSDALCDEQRTNNTRIISIYPGACNTDIWDSVDLAQDASPDRNGMLQPAEVASACVYALNHPQHILVDDITIQPTAPSL